MKSSDYATLERYKDWKGNVHQKEQLKTACNNFRQKCSKKILEQDRRQIFENYWQLGDVNRQRAFSNKHVDILEKERTRLRKPNKNSSEGEVDTQEIRKGRKGAFSFRYTLYSCGQRIVVCKTFFLNPLGISAQVVKTTFQKMGSIGIVAKDRRGKPSTNYKLSDSITQKIASLNRQKRTVILYVKEVLCPHQIKLHLHDGAKQTLKGMVEIKGRLRGIWVTAMKINDINKYLS
nr:unnamed protein product [Callosobruchus chinensis]